MNPKCKGCKKELRGIRVKYLPFQKDKNVPLEYYLCENPKCKLHAIRIYVDDLNYKKNKKK